ncbi:hypothetical protein [Micromonospora chokoriensis]|uniref:hypothetical protein n=1 Tax=Micromonospora chokoriensis TaxID=356851 RepID=UPI0004C339D6|nr:hypothetical protein [Micromonospora chokoriensis]
MDEHADEQEGPSAEELASRAMWFEQYVEALNQRSVVVEPGVEPVSLADARRAYAERQDRWERRRH